MLSFCRTGLYPPAPQRGHFNAARRRDGCPRFLAAAPDPIRLGSRTLQEVDLTKQDSNGEVVHLVVRNLGWPRSVCLCAHIDEMLVVTEIAGG